MRNDYCAPPRNLRFQIHPRRVAGQLRPKRENKPLNGETNGNRMIHFVPGQRAGITSTLPNPAGTARLFNNPPKKSP